MTYKEKVSFLDDLQKWRKTCFADSDRDASQSRSGCSKEDEQAEVDEILKNHFKLGQSAREELAGQIVDISQAIKVFEELNEDNRETERMYAERKQIGYERLSETQQLVYMLEVSKWNAEKELLCSIDSESRLCARADLYRDRQVGFLAEKGYYQENDVEVRKYIEKTYQEYLQEAEE